MKVFVAGATGALGQQLVPQLVANGHEVVGMTQQARQAGPRPQPRRPAGRRRRARPRRGRPGGRRGRARGDRPSAHGAVGRARPAPLRARPSRSPTGCAPRAPTTCSPPGARSGQALRRAELRRLAVRPHRRAGQDRGRPARPDAGGRRCARRSTRSATSRRRSPAPTWTEGIVLRYGGFYGPGTVVQPDPDGEHGRDDPQAQVPDRRRAATGVWSFIHIEDAAAATVAAIEHGQRGVYNVVDDEPAPGARVAAGAAARGRRPQADARAALARAARRRRGRGRHDDRGARRVERQGEARARLAAALPELARRASREGLG